MFNNLVTSYIRQGATLAVGAVLGWLTVKYQWLPFEDIDAMSVATWVQAAVTAVYYIVVRWLAEWFPIVGNLFLINSRPQYAASTEPVSTT